MLFVADALPAELVRIIEFLNEQMNPAEVLGVELRQYVGGDHTVYVTTVVGRTSTAVETKTAGVGQQWTEETFLEAARARRPEAEVALIERLVADVHSRGVKLGWGKGVTPGASGWYSVAGQPAAVWNLNVNADTPAARAYLYFYLGDLVQSDPVLNPERDPRTSGCPLRQGERAPRMVYASTANDDRSVRAQPRRVRPRGGRTVRASLDAGVVA
jgi:hypothetical protein